MFGRKWTLWTVWTVLVFAFCMGHAQTQTKNVQVLWDANTESDLAGYLVSVGESSGVYGEPVNLDKSFTSFTFNNLVVERTYYFAVQAYDSTGNVSEYSEERSIFLQGDVDTTAPATPVILDLRVVEE